MKKTPSESESGYGAVSDPWPRPMPEPAPQVRAGMPKWAKWCIGLAIVIGIGAGAATAYPGPAPRADNAVAPVATSAPKTGAGVGSALPSITKTPPGPAPAGSDITASGVLSVPAEAAPGSYATTVPADSFGCYWARLRALDAPGVDGVIDSGLYLAGDKVKVTIRPDDAGFETTGCGTWTAVRP